ncbi:MAG: hypothetical protein OHK0044_22960 [Burkholderiaceae bacterium]
MREPVRRTDPGGALRSTDRIAAHTAADAVLIGARSNGGLAVRSRAAPLLAGAPREARLAPRSAPHDQATGLRRLFARPSLRVLAVLVPAPRCPQRNAWLARLARAFAAAGERTLVLDASGAQLATTFGLKARFDLLHAMRGECEIAQARLAIDSGLALLPAVRAFDDAGRRNAALAGLVAAAPAAVDGFDLVVALLAAPHVALLAASGAEIAVPVAPSARDVAAALHAVRKCGQGADITGFRWLFLGMDDAAAATLARRLAAAARAWTAAPMRFGAALRGPRDAARFVHAAAGWNAARIELPERERMS